MHHKETLITAAKIIDERQQQYGSPDSCFTKAVNIANAVIGGEHKYTERELALILHCLKLARMQENTAFEDNYIDAINYLAFAGQFTKNPNQPAESGLKGITLPAGVMQTKGRTTIPLDLNQLENDIVG